MKLTRREFVRAVGFAAAGTALMGCAPMSEGRRPDYPQPAGTGGGAVQAQMGPITVTRTPEAQAVQAGYSAQTDPFAMDQPLRDIASGISGDTRAMVQAIFDRLHRGAAGGVSVMDMAGRAPRTASEALSQGGDCTDLANIVIALFREKGIAGGAMLVHFESAPANVDHMVPYVELDGRRTIVDLQAGTLGQTAQGRYTTIMTMTLSQAPGMYHREMGDYYRDAGRSQDAIAAYRRALELNEGDAYVHQNIGVLYERAGDMEASARHLRRAGELNPAYRRDSRRGSYNEELQAGQRAYQEGRYADCARHFQNALDSGERLSSDERRALQQNIEACRANAAGSGQKK
ncbi:MAG: tetratricopeptide repeat protein [Candidatus Micrarchaeota archaeon]